jgi:uncharacterized protein (DUF2147 family)
MQRLWWQPAGPSFRRILRRRGLIVRDRVQFIANSLLSAHLSDPSAARGQAISLLGQTLSQQVVAGEYGAALIALLGVALAGVLLFKFLLFKSGNRDAGQRVFRMRAGFHRSTGSRAFIRAATTPLRFRPSGVAAMLRFAGWHVLPRFAIVVAVGLVASSAWAAPRGDLLGTWTTANGRGVVAINQCGDALCGRIVGIDRKPTEPMPSDVDGRPQCGLTIITNERLQPDGTWLGKVTDPRDGDVYQAKLWLDGRGNLRLRGFIGIPVLGATQTWHRFTGHLTAACGLA